MGLDINEFLNGIKEFFTKDIINALQNACITMYTNIFFQANEATESAASQAMVAPENMFPGVYTVIINVAETVFFPIAGIILTCILCYECVELLTENNRMKDFGPWDVYILIMKLLGGILLLTKSVDLVNTCFKIGQWAVKKTGLESANAVLGEGLDAIDYIQDEESIMTLLGFLAMGCLVKIGIFMFSIIVKVAVWLRFVELYMFAVSAPLPFSTFLNNEWSQIGHNYLRKILSLAFQPVYMVLCFSIFNGILVIQPGSDILGVLAKAFVAMVLLGIALFKTGTVSDSIFNAH